MNKPVRIAKVAVPTPLPGSFDYLIPAPLDEDQDLVGRRVSMDFGRRKAVGVIIDIAGESELPANRLKPILSVLDDSPALDAATLGLLLWSARYYHHPIGEVIATSLPRALRGSTSLVPTIEEFWRVRRTEPGDALQRAPKQSQLFELLCEHPSGLSAAELNERTTNWRDAMRALIEKDLVETFEGDLLPAFTDTPEEGPELRPEQRTVVDAITAHSDEHHIHLLHGITGSGKTEVYIEAVREVLDAGKQALILVPEISLTPQLTDRFEKRLGVRAACLHSGLNPQQRHRAWYSASTGNARLVIGTRSAVFTPIPDLGIIVIDEEHDSSYKQQDGLRYNARDIALVRARDGGLPVILGSATPSLESLHNVNSGRYRLHRLMERANDSAPSRIELIDMCSQPLTDGITARVFDEISRHIERGEQAMLFLNRRGFSPVLMCHDCGWTTHCSRCDSHMTYHRKQERCRCHHCGTEIPAPVTCGECGGQNLIAIGLGTERVESLLEERFPETKINRIDRDTTRRKGALEAKLSEVHSGETGILIGTQMLAKGHDFPNVTLVVVLDTDQALYSADFRAAEHLAQLIIQVAGRAGRGSRAGRVLIQTHHPDHPLLQTLIHAGYDAFAEASLRERAETGFPPSSHMAILRCEAIHQVDGMNFMQEARQRFDAMTNTCTCFGPLPAPMERRAGRYRTQIILQSSDRRTLHSSIDLWLPEVRALKLGRKVRWSLDVDPIDTY